MVNQWKSGITKKRKTTEASEPDSSSSEILSESPKIIAKVLSNKERDEQRSVLWNTELPPVESWTTLLEKGVCFICNKVFARTKTTDDTALVRHLQEHGAQLWEQLLLPDERASIEVAAASHEKALR
jgi:hypothetical protein